MRGLLRVLLLVSAVLLAVLLSLPFSPMASRLAVAALNGINGLELRYSSGALVGDLVLEQVSYQSETVRVTARDVESRISASCLLKSEICFSRLDASSVSVELLSGVDRDDVLLIV